MRHIKIFILFFSIATFLVATGCGSNAKNKTINKENISSLLILGNSILRHPPAPEIGWLNDWGMAASAIDSDFVHILIRNINSLQPGVTVKYKSIADFERNYLTYDFNQLKDFTNPDILVMKIGENVDDSKAISNNFIQKYDQLIRFLSSSGSTKKIIVDGFWEHQNVNNLIRQYATENHLSLVTITDLSHDESNKAIGLFIHAGVAAHPSNKGMRNIATRIWRIIKNYF